MITLQGWTIWLQGALRLTLKKIVESIVSRMFKNKQTKKLADSSECCVFITQFWGVELSFSFKKLCYAIKAMQSYQDNSNFQGVFGAVLYFGTVFISSFQSLLFSFERYFCIWNLWIKNWEFLSSLVLTVPALYSDKSQYIKKIDLGRFICLFCCGCCCFTSGLTEFSF